MKEEGVMDGWMDDPIPSQFVAISDPYDNTIITRITTIKEEQNLMVLHRRR